MIKLKQILKERYVSSGVELPDPVDKLYDFYHRAYPHKKVNLARRMIGLYGKHLTAAHVYHIILGLPQMFVLPMYEFAKQHLTPEQLADTATQIELFHQPKHPEISQAAQ